MKRICPTEEMLGEYVSGCVSPHDRAEIERHLAECQNCRSLVSEAHEAMSSMDISEIRSKVRAFAMKNIWLLTGILFFLTSFIFSGYFFQFLAVSVLCGLKWIVDSRNTRTVIMIQESKNPAEKRHSDISFLK
jgi:hypothetical protein